MDHCDHRDCGALVCFWYKEKPVHRTFVSLTRCNATCCTTCRACCTTCCTCCTCTHWKLSGKTMLSPTRPYLWLLLSGFGVLVWFISYGHKRDFSQPHQASVVTTRNALTGLPEEATSSPKPPPSQSNRSRIPPDVLQRMREESTT